MKQEYSSADTSLNQVSRAFTIYQSKIGFIPGSEILDYGGGKFDAAVAFMKNYGCNVKVYDPYNRSPTHNSAVLNHFSKKKPDYIVCANVLNVIKENEIVGSVISAIKSLSGKSTVVIFCVYEGNGSGHGAKTTKGWQRNQKTDSYVPLIKRYFPYVEKRYGLIIAHR